MTTTLNYHVDFHIERRGHGAGPVAQGDVVGQLVGQSAEDLDRRRHVVAGLEEVPDHERHAEPLADLASAAEGQRSGQSAVVDDYIHDIAAH